MVHSLDTAPPIARRLRTGARPGPVEHTGAKPRFRAVPVAPPPPPEPPAPTAPVSHMCQRGTHQRCRGTVLLPDIVDGKRYVRCGCTAPDCQHGSPRRD